MYCAFCYLNCLDAVFSQFAAQHLVFHLPPSDYSNCLPQAVGQNGMRSKPTLNNYVMLVFSEGLESGKIFKCKF